MIHDDALEQLRTVGDPAKAAEMARYHKVERPYLGLANPAIDAMVTEWRAAVDLDARLALASGLWDSNVHEARVAAAKLLTQARIRPDDQAAWDLITSWVPTFDTATLADLVSVAGQKRLVADPQRLDQVEAWITSDHMWTRRAALVMALPWTKQNHPKSADLAIRDRILGWIATCTTDHDRLIQDAIGTWLYELSKHDAPRVSAFLAEHGAAMKPYAFREARRKLTA